MYKEVKKITDMHVYSNPESGYERGFNEGIEVAMNVLYMQEAINPWRPIGIEIPKQEMEQFTNKILPSKYCITYDCKTMTYGISRYWNNMFIDVTDCDAHSPTHWKYANIEPPEGFDEK